jgi:hypothetical protein
MKNKNKELIKQNPRLFLTKLSENRQRDPHSLTQKMSNNNKKVVARFSAHYSKGNHIEEFRNIVNTNRAAFKRTWCFMYITNLNNEKKYVIDRLENEAGIPASHISFSKWIEYRKRDIEQDFGERAMLIISRKEPQYTELFRNAVLSAISEIEKKYKDTYIPKYQNHIKRMQAEFRYKRAAKAEEAWREGWKNNQARLNYTVIPELPPIAITTIPTIHWNSRIQPLPSIARVLENKQPPNLANSINRIKNKVTFSNKTPENGLVSKTMNVRTPWHEGWVVNQAMKRSRELPPIEKTTIHSNSRIQPLPSIARVSENKTPPNHANSNSRIYKNKRVTFRNKTPGYTLVANNNYKNVLKTPWWRWVLTGKR